MRTAIVAAALAFSALGCGDSTPTTPMSALPEWNLSGMVRSSGVGLSGASVVAKGRPLPAVVTQTITDASGHYVFPSLEEGSYFVEAGAVGHVTIIQPVTLTSAQAVDFDLPRNPN